MHLSVSPDAASVPASTFLNLPFRILHFLSISDQVWVANLLVAASPDNKRRKISLCTEQKWSTKKRQRQGVKPWGQEWAHLRWWQSVLSCIWLEIWRTCSVSKANAPLTNPILFLFRNSLRWNNASSHPTYQVMLPPSFHSYLAQFLVPATPLKVSQIQFMTGDAIHQRVCKNFCQETSQE